jgi:hypothetical protein
MTQKQQFTNTNPKHKTAKSSPSAEQKQDNAQQTVSSQTDLDMIIQRAKENPQLLKTTDIIHLQRTLGNKAVSRLLPARPISNGVLARSSLIQLKPADINGTQDIDYDSTGKLLNPPAPRARGLKRSIVINSQLKEGWVTPNVQVMGAHLIKAEYGGPDNETNVVPWIQSTEDRFGLFEGEYRAAADKDAKQAALAATAFKATIHAKATFADRPDLLVNDGDLDTAGWGPADVKRQERKDKYTDVAEKFSGIPNAVKVEVSGLTEGTKKFEVAAGEIAPTYAKNPEAVKPGYVVPTRFVRNATEARLFPKIPDWDAFKKAKVKAVDDVARQKKLNHVAARHAVDFGVAGNTMEHLKTLEATLSTFIADAANQEQIVGMYMGKEVLHYVNNATRLWACTSATGELVAAFRLSVGQHDILTTKGKVG